MRDRTLRSRLLAPLCIALALLQSTLAHAQPQPPVRLSGLQDAALARQQEFFHRPHSRPCMRAAAA